MDDLADAAPTSTADGAAEILRVLQAPDPVRWVVVRDPGDLSAAAGRHGFGDDVVEALRTTGRDGRRLAGDAVHARLVRTADGTVVVATPTLSYDAATRQVTTGEVTLVVGDDVVLTAESGDADVLGRAAERLASGPAAPDDGVRRVVATTLLALVATAADIEVEIGDAVAQAEAAVFAADPSGDPVERIYGLKREIAEARRALGPVTSVLPELIADEADEAEGTADGERTLRWLRRVQTAADRVDTHLDAHDGLLGDMLSAYLSQVSVRQNEDMRRISAWAAIIAVPSLITGVFGMNFDRMFGMSWAYGYPVTLVAMVGLCVVLHRLFRRSGWL